MEKLLFVSRIKVFPFFFLKTSFFNHPNTLDFSPQNLTVGNTDCTCAFIRMAAVRGSVGGACIDNFTFLNTYPPPVHKSDPHDPCISPMTRV